MSEYPVLTDDAVWPEFADAVRSLGASWTAPSGRSYRLDFDGRRLTVWGASAAAPDDEVDSDLLELAAAVHDAAGGIWSGEAVRQTAAIWGFAS